MLGLTENVLKEHLARRGARVPRGTVVTTVESARAAAADLGGRAVVKAMVPRKDRAALGLVRVVSSPRDAAEAARAILADAPAAALLVEELAPAGDEHYLAMGFDLVAGAPVLMHGPGGSGVERSAAPPRQVPLRMDAPIPADAVDERLHQVAQTMFDEFQALRAQMLEVNPVRVVGADAWVLDAKAILDPAAPTPPGAVPVGRPDEVEERLTAEAAALRGGTEVRFGRLAGDIGVVSAGGGVLALLNDALLRHGLEPANFADVSGGSATTRLLGSVAREVVALKPRAVLVITGITSSVPVLDLARTMRDALAPLADVGEPVPIVARMAGTGEEEAGGILGDLPHCRVVGRDTTVEECVATLAGMVAGSGEDGA